VKVEVGEAVGVWVGEGVKVKVCVEVYWSVFVQDNVGVNVWVEEWSGVGVLEGTAGAVGATLTFRVQPLAARMTIAGITTSPQAHKRQNFIVSSS
jgi:hypothetical protein